METVLRFPATAPTRLHAASAVTMMEGALPMDEAMTCGVGMVMRGGSGEEVPLCFGPYEIKTLRLQLRSGASTRDTTAKL